MSSLLHPPANDEYLPEYLQRRLDRAHEQYAAYHEARRYWRRLCAVATVPLLYASFAAEPIFSLGFSAVLSVALGAMGFFVLVHMADMRVLTTIEVVMLSELIERRRVPTHDELTSLTLGRLGMTKARAGVAGQIESRGGRLRDELLPMVIRVGALGRSP